MIEKLAPIDWPITTPIEIPSDSGDPMANFLRSSDAAAEFMKRAFAEQYLPRGVRFALPASIAADDIRLNLSAHAILVPPFGDAETAFMVAEMARVTRRNQEAGFSYYQKVLEDYRGRLGSVFVLSPHRAPEDLSDISFHVAWRRFEMAPIETESVDQDKFWQAVGVKHEELNPISFPLSKIPIANRIESKRELSGDEVRICRTTVWNAGEAEAFANFIESVVAVNAHYFQEVEILSSRATIVLVAPRPYTVGIAPAESSSQRDRLNVSGITFILDSDLVPSADLIRRCYFLADRVDALITTARSLLLQSEGAVSRLAYSTMEHSLRNAFELVSPEDARTRAILRVELYTMLGLRTITSSESTMLDVEPVNWSDGRVPFEQVLVASYAGGADSIVIDAKTLHGKSIDPRLFPIIVELVRNAIKNGHRDGSTQVHILANGGSVSIRATNRCRQRSVEGLVELLRSKELLNLDRGMPLLLSLLGRIGNPHSRLVVTIGLQENSEDCAVEIAMPSRGQLPVSLRMGMKANQQLTSGHSPRPIEFTVNVEVADLPLMA